MSVLSILFDVVTQITLPIVLLAAGGYGLQKWARFDVATLNRLLIYATFPCFIVVTLSQATIPLAQVQWTALFTVVQFVVLLAIGWWVGQALGLRRDLCAVVALACSFPNSGNFGIPVIELAFGRELVVHQVVITAVHTIVILAVAPLLFAGPQDSGLRGHLKAIFQTPMIPAVALGLALNALGLRLPEVVETPMETLGQAYVGVALFALGAQLAASSVRVPPGAASLSIALRLLLAPLLTGIALLFLPFPSDVAALLFVGACAPVGVLVSIFAAEFRGNVELSSAVVIASTLLAPILVTLALVIVRL